MKQWRKSSRFRKAYKKVMESKSSRNAVRLYRLEYNNPVFKRHQYDFVGYSNISTYAIQQAINKWSKQLNDNWYLKHSCLFPKNAGNTIRYVKQND